MRLKISVVFFSMILSLNIYADIISLTPSQSKLLTNHYAWTLNATCNIKGHLDNGKILIRVIEKESTINGKHLVKGETTAMHVKTNQNIAVTAGPGTEVKLINVGKNTVEAVCL